MLSLEIMGTLYGKNDGMPLCQEFHYMTQKDWVFVANVVVIEPMWETMVSSVISQLASAVVKLNTIAKFCKYRRLHERHHFILMTMEVHGTPGRDMDHFIRECACLFHDRQLKGQIFKQCVNTTFQHV
jgi:hypothetical protein